MAPEEYKYEHFNIHFPAEHVAHVEINRPQKLNAFIESMWLDLRAIFNRLSTSPSVRSIVLTGAGDRAFTAGLDVQAASQGESLGDSQQSDPARRAVRFLRHVDEFQDCISALERCEKPIITVLHGFSYGLAIDLSLATDVRIAAADARLSVKEVDIGIAADIGTLSRLPKAVASLSWVKDVTLSGRIFGAEEALRMGLVSGVETDKESAVARAVEWARLVAGKSPVAVQGTKEIVNYSRDHSVADGLRYCAVWNMSMTQTQDVKEAMTSGMQKRKPTFEKL